MTQSTHPPPQRKCYRLTDGIQKNKAGETDLGGGVGVLTDRDRHTESPQRDGQKGCWKASLAFSQVT